MAPESIKEEMEIQASTTKMMNSSLMEEHKVEEEEDDDEGSDIDRRYKYVPEPEPEWDVDSYDGREYETDPEDRQFFSDEDSYQEFRTRKRQAIESKGFLPEPLSGTYPIQDLEEVAYRNMTARELNTDLANLCVKKLNDEKGTTVELVEIVRVIELGGATWNSYITFMAREYPNGPLVEYHAKVMSYVGQEKPPFPILCRPSPKLSV
ncbi:putative protein [Arabidopsis thaliana]|uniref:Cystatin/monellin superfamily protein n=1 Tax=Arabidopsis thaliana TaxID=3702 RepID=Q9LFJ1_ARATH|nr:Cystatin/monellin superfamily protein [Arabidopsis thaliana]AED92385.1 Cystatin/monellin superfamily protein [Arabidopsis thaliana]CAC01725.1 putative protein [Arabidopsis thaliana]|eukprot:NP_197214.1 Cystatin/monellin superfamily protein [Arabidopsis thaliana]